MFIHRIGRTARFGRRGCTLTFLSEHETGYVGTCVRLCVRASHERLLTVSLRADYVKADGVQFVPMQVDTSAAPALLEQLRKAAERDRELMEKGLLAFVSYVRAYREHLCKFIFRLDRVNLGVVRVARVVRTRARGLAHAPPPRSLRARSRFCDCRACPS